MSQLNTAEEIPEHSQIAVTNYGSRNCLHRLASVVLVHRVFVLVHGVFVLVKGVLLYGVFVLVQEDYFVFEITKTKTPEFTVKFDLKLGGKNRTEDNLTD